MSRPHGRARISARYPQALATCDFCGFLYNHSDLRWNYDWQGVRLANTRMLVCATCQDTPAEFRRTIILPPDPVPIANPRPENYTIADNPMTQAGWDPLNLVPKSS